MATTFESLEEMVGRTPLLRLRPRREESGRARLLLKLEAANPGGSVKDRTALALIRHGERTGLLKPNGVIVEPTSGNTGLGLAMIAARRGYRCIFTVLDKVSEEKMALLRAYGAEVVVCPTSVPPDHPDSYYSVAREIARKTPGSFQPEQYSNLVNQQVHYESTGPEVWQQTKGKVSHFVAGAGTGGTISGVGRYLKERRRSVEIVCADPVGSIYSTSSPHSYLTEGVGEDFFPANYDREVVDTVEAVSDDVAFSTCHDLVRDEGLLTGGSGGLVVAAALRVARRAGRDALVVALVPDSGRGYMSKIYSPEWLLEHGFRRAPEGTLVGAALEGLGVVGSTAVNAIPSSASIGEAAALLLESGLPALPVASTSRPASVGDISAAVSVHCCRDRAGKRAVSAADPVTAILDPPLPVVGIGQELEEAMGVVAGSSCFVVADRGRPAAVVETADVAKLSLGSLAEPPTVLAGGGAEDV